MWKIYKATVVPYAKIEENGNASLIKQPTLKQKKLNGDCFFTSEP